MKPRHVVLGEKPLMEGWPRGADGRDIPFGGYEAGYSWRAMLLAPESIHQDVNFSGYPMGGLHMSLWLNGSVEAICKAQSLVKRDGKGEP